MRSAIDDENDIFVCLLSDFLSVVLVESDVLCSWSGGGRYVDHLV